MYTVPVQLGSNNQSFDLQVDMGSADLVRLLCYQIFDCERTDDELILIVGRIEVMLICLLQESEPLRSCIVKLSPADGKGFQHTISQRASPGPYLLGFAHRRRLWDHQPGFRSVPHHSLISSCKAYSVTLSSMSLQRPLHLSIMNLSVLTILASLGWPCNPTRSLQQTFRLSRVATPTVKRLFQTSSAVLPLPPSPRNSFSPFF